VKYQDLLEGRRTAPSEPHAPNSCGYLLRLPIGSILSKNRSLHQTQGNSLRDPGAGRRDCSDMTVNNLAVTWSRNLADVGEHHMGG